VALDMSLEESRTEKGRGHLPKQKGYNFYFTEPWLSSLSSLSRYVGVCRGMSERVCRYVGGLSGMASVGVCRSLSESVGAVWPDPILRQCR